MCHNDKGHGMKWKALASRVNKVFPELTIVSRCHNYDSISTTHIDVIYARPLHWRKMENNKIVFHLKTDHFRTRKWWRTFVALAVAARSVFIWIRNRENQNDHPTKMNIPNNV